VIPVSDRDGGELRRLARLQAVLDAAEPDSLDRTFWRRILEAVEELPEPEAAAWKTHYLPALRRACRPSRSEEQPQ